MGRNFIYKLKRIDCFIAKRATGTPAVFAERMEMSETTLFEYLAIMKDFGAPIKYERFRKSYYYAYEGRFRVSFMEGLFTDTLTDPAADSVDPGNDEEPA